MTTSTTKDYAKLDKEFVWHPFTQMKDWLADDIIVIERGEGSYLFDTDGNRYIDGVSSLWATVHGHQKPELDDAIKDQLGKIAHTTFLGLSNVPAVELAEKLIEIAPDGLGKVFYSDSGSSAVEVALKMAYQYWQQKKGNDNKKRKKFIHLSDSYHGDTLGSVSVGGISLFHEVYGPLLFDTIELPSPHPYRCPYKAESIEECLTRSLKKLDDLLKENEDSVVAVIMEPIMQGAAGMIKHPEGFMRGVRNLTKEHGVLLIFDEVATGFGRTGKMFACEQEDVSPDILTLGKGITGGYLPLSATLTTNEIYEGFLAEYKDFKSFFHGHTYTGNPLAAAVAVANLEVFEKENTLAHLQSKIKFITHKLESFKQLNHVGDIRQAGTMVGIELVQDKETKEPFDPALKIGDQVIRKAREKGVMIRPLGNVIVLMPPLNIEDEVLEELLDVVEWAISEVTNG